MLLSEDILFGPFVLSMPQQQLWHAGSPVGLKPKEAELLAFLAQQRPRTISKDEIIEQLWRGTDATDGALSQTVYRLRQVLARYAGNREFIRTIPGIGLQFTGGSPVEMTNPTPDFQRETFPLYQQAVSKFRRRTEGAILQSIGLLERVCERDPTYLAAQTMLAKGYVTAGIRLFYEPGQAYWRAKRALAAVIDADPSSAEAFAALATLLLFFGANREHVHSAVEHALILGPQLPAAHNAAVWERLSRRDFAAALTQADLAVRARPDSASATSLLGTALYLAGRYDEARRYFENALTLDSEHATALFYDACSCTMTGAYDIALRRLDSLSGVDLATRATAVRGIIAARCGDAQRAHEAIDALKASEIPAEISLCALYLAVGEIAPAAATLERALGTREPALFLAAIDPMYAGFRSSHPQLVRSIERGRAPQCDRCSAPLRPREVREFFECSLCAGCRPHRFANASA
jgi:DNA-binding winged helix-turn-helix (wHTH) protein/Flp pilus assembly protein TadD